ncbi:MAG: hypothetical protein DRO43_03620 [Candidatus Hecatellales archaeon]|nr:MAG: hypothetical protein DRO43_03620 [Candidatus Hecatellales archaeon]
MANVLKLLQDSEVLRLLYKLHVDLKAEIIPRISSKGVYYPLLREVLNREADDVSFLNKLYEEGFLLRDVYDKIFRCPDCSSADLRPRLQCPNCGSANFSCGEVLVHYSCGHVDFEGNFQAGESLLKCPECGKPLKQVGIDYGEPGKAYKCLHCGDFFYYPMEYWVCCNCSKMFKPMEASAEDVFVYRFNEAMKGEVEKVLSYVKPISQAFEKAGFTVECFPELKGKSGSKHIVDIYAIAGNGRRKVRKLIVDVEEKPDGGMVTLDEFLRFVAKVLDLKEKGTKSLMLAIPNLEKEAKMVASKLKIEWIEARSVEEATLQVDRLLSSL